MAGLVTALRYPGLHADSEITDSGGELCRGGWRVAQGQAVCVVAVGRGVTWQAAGRKLGSNAAAGVDGGRALT